MPTPTATMSAKTCLITGGTAGIGLVAARELARLGATVVIVGRNRDRGAAAIDAIRRETGNGRVEFQSADLSSQADLRRLASDFLASHHRLDVLINNAGAIFALRQESVDGIEMTLALNHMAYFLLTNLLLDALKASAPARIINVSSASHESAGQFDLDDPLARSRRYRTAEWSNAMYTFLMPWAHPAYVQYGQTKLANLLFTYELAERLRAAGVTVNAMHPGFVATNFTSGNGSYGWFMRRWASLFGTRPERGAETLIYLASSPDVDGVSGKYFVKCKPVESSPASRDPEAMRRLWKLSEGLVKSEPRTKSAD